MTGVMRFFTDGHERTNKMIFCTMWSYGQFLRTCDQFILRCGYHSCSIPCNRRYCRGRCQCSVMSGNILFFASKLTHHQYFLFLNNTNLSGSGNHIMGMVPEAVKIFFKRIPGPKKEVNDRILITTAQTVQMIPVLTSKLHSYNGFGIMAWTYMQPFSLFCVCVRE